MSGVRWRSAWGLAPLLVAATFGHGIPAVQAGGAWSQEVRAPTIRQRDWRYETPGLTPHDVPNIERAQVTRVSWRYDYDPPDPAMNAWLCAASTCVDASAGRGMSDAFAGTAAGTAFKFYFLVTGQGMLPTPLQSSGIQLIVNYR